MWRIALESQGFRTHQEWPEVDILAAIATHSPKLVILDMTSGLFNPYALCRDVQARFPGIPIVLTCHEHRDIDPVERRWALQQGAAELMPALSPHKGLVDSIKRVIQLAAAGLVFNATALDAVVAPPSAPPTVPQATPEPTVEAVAPEPPPEVKPKLMYRGRPIN
ncbi:MAG: response regulator [Synechococcaceae cyanobacterium SM2_3_60]|nr:response regulator [Synechococcaceae cyanobacterium SM2_3_60]